MTGAAAVAQRPLIFGEVLFDSFVDGGNILGGAPFNVAWNLRMLGADPLFVGAVGNDELGQQVRTAMVAAGLDTRGLQVTQEAPTGRVQVTLESGEPSYDILADQAYDRVQAEALQAVVSERAPLLYHGSLALRSEPSRSACDWLAGRSQRRFVDVNLRRPWYQAGTVRDLIRGADYVKLNLDELRELAAGSDDESRVAGLFEQVGIREAVILTSGAAGAGIHTRDGGRVAAPAPEVTDLRDPVGAGDAFASVVILGILNGWGWEQTLERALDFAARVCSLQGATSTDADFYAAARAGWEV